MIAALLLVAATASAAPAPHAKPYWMKTYSLAPYRETWTGSLSVKKLVEALPQVEAAVVKNGGRLTQPMALFVGSSTEKQISLVLPLKKSKDLSKDFRKIGKVAEPAVRPIGAPIPLEEVREKLARLTKEKTENRAALALAPVASEAIDEMIEHLANVEAVGRSAESEVLWNLTVKETR